MQNLFPCFIVFKNVFALCFFAIITFATSLLLVCKEVLLFFTVLVCDCVSSNKTPIKL